MVYCISINTPYWQTYKIYPVCISYYKFLEQEFFPSFNIILCGTNREQNHTLMYLWSAIGSLISRWHSGTQLYCTHDSNSHFPQINCHGSIVLQCVQPTNVKTFSVKNPRKQFSPYWIYLTGMHSLLTLRTSRIKCLNWLIPLISFSSGNSCSYPLPNTIP